jgi:hypothetical protein
LQLRFTGRRQLLFFNGIDAAGNEDKPCNCTPIEFPPLTGVFTSIGILPEYTTSMPLFGRIRLHGVISTARVFDEGSLFIHRRLWKWHTAVCFDQVY